MPESQVSRETLDLLLDCLCYAVTPDSHVNFYPIPGPRSELAAGEPRMTYVWYRNVPAGAQLDELLTDRRGFAASMSVQPGQVQDHYVTELRRAADEQLPPAVAELVTKNVLGKRRRASVTGVTDVLSVGECGLLPRPATRRI